MVNKTVWCIAYINRKFIKTVADDLKDRGFEDIKVYMPTVKLLAKKFKNKNHFEFVPLLFNYGFFQVPFDKACNHEYLTSLRVHIPAIRGWVKDPITIMSENPRLRLDNGEHEAAVTLPKAALATDREIARLIQRQDTFSVFSAEDLTKISPGDHITLRGYPFDNMPAEIVKINFSKKEVEVKILIETLVKKVKVSFENVFYTVYNDYDEDELSKYSLDEIRSQNTASLDKLYSKLSTE